MEGIMARDRSSFGGRSLRARCVVALSAALAALGFAGEAAATGMQGHMYMAQCAAEQAKDTRLRALFDAHALHLANGAIFPDSGYTAPDHDQGEIAHWEQYIEGYIQTLRERYASPLDDPEGAAQVAFLMGAAAHGITDSTFDALLYARAEQVEPADTDSLDTAMDIFLVHDMPRFYVPEPAFDAKLLSDVYVQKIPHAVTPDAIEDAMSTARSGVAVVTKLLHVGADDYGQKYPWSRSHFRDPRTPGGYAHGAKVVLGYYREILRRLDGGKSADGVVIGTYPEEAYPLVTLDPTRPDGKVLFFFGEGMDRTTIDDNSVILRDDMGNVIPSKVDVFRGDQWANVLRVEAMVPWKPGTKYTAVLGKGIKTLSGASPSADQEISFTTCTPSSPGGDCDEPQGAPPPSPCPTLDAKYVTPEGEEEEMDAGMEEDAGVVDAGTDAGKPPVEEPPVQQDSGCAVSAPERDAGAWSAVVLALAAACSVRRRKR
ncbi:Hypothetical protein A7982_07325 [Minicystis rosea]|nr:Hypothetical protein A7982_07325 [Minicystis rosea]